MSVRRSEPRRLWPMAVIVRAPAKINLALAVAPPRAGDGLHPICSWFAPISLQDELSIKRLPLGVPSHHGIRWADDAPRPTTIDWPVEKDLAVRAHRVLECECSRELPISLDLIKRIPVGGGLGGGSSDAAAMLRALIRLFDLTIPADRLRALALTLGSDVPYFLLDPLTPAVVEGVGESIEPVPEVCAPIILILPSFGCPTGAVYKAFDAGPPCEFRADAVRRMARTGRIDPALLFNDLAIPAETIEPRLSEIRRCAESVTGGPVHLTGSGSTMFIVRGDLPAQVLDSLRDQLKDCRVIDVTAAPAAFSAGSAFPFAPHQPA